MNGVENCNNIRDSYNATKERFSSLNVCRYYIGELKSYHTDLEIHEVKP